MSKYEPVEDEYEPGSNGLVLRNKLGITDPREMEIAETQALEATQQSFFDELDGTETFSVKRVSDMHLSWLGRIYEFAGQVRHVDVSKGGFRFATAQFLASNLKQFELEHLSRLTPCLVNTTEEAAERMAIIHGEFIMLHPFREGNGRVGRWLVNAMAVQAGFPIPRYGFLTGDDNEQRKRYLKAVKRAVLTEYSELTQFFSEAISLAIGDKT